MGRVPAAPRPLCLAPFSQDPMIGNYHTQVIVTVPYISTLQLPGVVHVGRFSSVFTKPFKRTHARQPDTLVDVAHAWASSNQDAGKYRAGPASSRHVRDGSEICIQNKFIFVPCF